MDFDKQQQQQQQRHEVFEKAVFTSDDAVVAVKNKGLG